MMITPAGFVSRGGTHVLNKATKDNEMRLRNQLIRNLDPHIFGPCIDHYDTIDLSRNLIEKLEKLPVTERLRTLILHDNLIDNIDVNLHISIPNLQNLILTGNRISKIASLNGLKKLKNLKMLILIDNPITDELKDYRLHVIHYLPQLRCLDFKRIRRQEIRESEDIFGPGFE